MFFVQCGIINANALELLETLKGRGMKGLFSECELTIFFFFFPPFFKAVDSLSVAVVFGIYVH